LPPDLNSLYAKCFAGIQSLKGRQILRWIYASTRSFKIKELCEFLAIDPEIGKLQRSLIVEEDAIFEECANLVFLNVNDEVLLVHHSLHQFLGSTDSRSPNWDITLEQLDLGKLCLKYLTGPDFSLAVTIRDPHTPIPFNAALLVQQVMPAMATVLSWYPGMKRAPQRASVNLKSINPTRKYASNLPRALEYARKSWLPLTLRLTKMSDHWPKFLDVALQPSQQFDFHPWTCLDISAQAHYSKLLGWAITHSHVPLFHSLQEADPEPRPEIYGIPLPEYDGVLPLHLAASIQSTMTPEADLIFRRLWSLCDRSAVDARGMTVLHYAAIGGNDMILHFIVDSALIDLEQKDLQNRTALATAAIEQRTNSLILLANFGADVDVVYDVTGIAKGMCPIMTAAQNGDDLSVQTLLAKNAITNRTNSARRKVLHYVVMNATTHSGEIVEELLRKHGPTDSPDSGGRTALELACYARNVQAATVLVREAYNSRQGTPTFFWNALQSDSKVVTIMIQAGALSGSKHPFMNWAAIRRLKELSRDRLFDALRTMIQAGLDFDVEDEGHRTPLFWAKNSDCEDLIKAVEWVQSLDPASLPCNQLATLPPGIIRPARMANANPRPLPPNLLLEESIPPSSESPSDAANDTARQSTHNKVPDDVNHDSAPNESHSTNTKSCALINPTNAARVDHNSPTYVCTTVETNTLHSSKPKSVSTTAIDEVRRYTESTTLGSQLSKLVKSEDSSDRPRGRTLISARNIRYMTTSELASLLLYAKACSVWTEEQWRLVIKPSWLQMTMDKLGQSYSAMNDTHETLAATITRLIINLDFLLSLLPGDSTQHYHLSLVDTPKPNMVIDELVRLLYFGEIEGPLLTRCLRRISCPEHHPSDHVLSLHYQNLGPGVLLCLQVVTKERYDLEDLR
jgi:ankyrin repeat protein